MCNKRKKIVPNFEAPIFSNLVYKDMLIVSCGGGGKRFGLKNRIIVYKNTNNSQLQEKLFEMDT
jgi:hypothetical protein